MQCSFLRPATPADNDLKVRANTVPVEVCMEKRDGGSYSFLDMLSSRRTQEL